MAIIVEATFENGVLRPDEALPLKEQARVRLAISGVDEDYDPLDAVIGICREGPDISLAEEHDRIIYGLGAPMGGQP